MVSRLSFYISGRIRLKILDKDVLDNKRFLHRGETYTPLVINRAPVPKSRRVIVKLLLRVLYRYDSVICNRQFVPVRSDHSSWSRL